MLKKNLFLLGLLIATSTALFSCKGDTGAQGPTGASGNTANVTVYTYSVSAASWVTNTSYPWEIDCTLPTTGAVNTTGDMDCYYSVDSANYTQLPWITNGNAPFFEQSWVYNSAGVTSIRWYNVSSNPTTAPTPPVKAWFKIVSIPPSVIKQNPNTNWDNWSEVSAVLAQQKAISH